MEDYQIVDSSKIQILLNEDELKQEDFHPEIIVDPIVIKEIPSDIEVSIYDGLELLRSLCANDPTNILIIDKLEAVFNPLNTTECSSNLFDLDYETIDNIDELKKVISELLIRFDTNPKHYSQSDYLFLMGIIYKSLIHLYEVSTGSVITKEWHDPLRDDLVPSEKLTKETIDQEVTDRAHEITRVEGLIQQLGLEIDNKLSLKEDKSNKVISFQQIPDNTHYPSEKLVKDNLDELLGLIAICL